MKSVLGILGLAVAFIFISLLIRKPGELTANPQEAAEIRQAAEEKQAKEQEKLAAAKGAKVSTNEFNPPREGVKTAVMSVKGLGDIEFEFYPKAAPKSVEQITGLIAKGYYNGILVHRVENGTLVQFGNGNTKADGPDAKETEDVPVIPYEPNELKHFPSTVALALKEAKSDTATSQMFINISNNPMWNGDYSVIGKVTKGMEIVVKVQKGDLITSFKMK